MQANVFNARVMQAIFFLVGCVNQKSEKFSVSRKRGLSRK